MNYRIVHRTEYTYADPASLCYNEARLLPRAVELPQLTQVCRSRSLFIEPAYSDFRERTDYFGNNVVYYTIRRPHASTVITAVSEVNVEANVQKGEMLLQQTAGLFPWEQVRTRLKVGKTPGTFEACQFAIDSPMVSLFPALTEYATPSFPAGRPILEAVHDLMQRIFQDLDFVPGATNIATPLSDVLAQRRGVCQDYAHLMIGCLRSQGLAARYVSGYIETLPPPGQIKLLGSDASHAWCSVFVPQMGWVDFDPTNNHMPSNQHIILGWGRDFSDVTPLKGVFFSTGNHSISVSVDVIRMGGAGVVSQMSS